MSKLKKRREKKFLFLLCLIYLLFMNIVFEIKNKRLKTFHIEII